MITPEILKTATEMELRNLDITSCNTIEELTQCFDALINREHDFGSKAAATAVALQLVFVSFGKWLQLSGEQAGFADMHFIGKSRNYLNGFMIVDFAKLLFPDFCNEQHFPTWQTLRETYASQLADEAKNLINVVGEKAHPDIIQHWKEIVEFAKKNQQEEKKNE